MNFEKIMQGLAFSIRVLNGYGSLDKGVLRNIENTKTYLEEQKKENDRLMLELSRLQTENTQLADRLGAYEEGEEDGEGEESSQDDSE